MLKDSNQANSVYNVCFRNSSARNPEDQSIYRDPVVVWSWAEDLGNPVLLVPQTPTPNTRELLIGISVDGPAIVSIRKYFSAGAAFVTETFAVIASGTHTLKSTTLLDSVEVWVIPDDPDVATLDLHCFASITARP